MPGYQHACRQQGRSERVRRAYGGPGGAPDLQVALYADIAHASPLSHRFPALNSLSPRRSGISDSGSPLPFCCLVSVAYAQRSRPQHRFSAEIALSTAARRRGFLRSLIDFKDRSQHRSLLAARPMIHDEAKAFGRWVMPGQPAAHTRPAMPRRSRSLSACRARGRPITRIAAGRRITALSCRRTFVQGDALPRYSAPPARCLMPRRRQARHATSRRADAIDQPGWRRR